MTIPALRAPLRTAISAYDGANDYYAWRIEFISLVRSRGILGRSLLHRSDLIVMKIATSCIAFSLSPFMLHDSLKFNRDIPYSVLIQLKIRLLSRENVRPRDYFLSRLF